MSRQDSSSATKILWGQILIVSIVALLFVWAATQWVAFRLGFEAEEEPEEFFGEPASKTVSGTFVALVSPAPVVSDDEDGDWDLDLSPASIAGEAIGAAAAVPTDHGAEHDFLKVGNRGRQSVKRAIVQTGTRLSIGPEICITWAE